MASKIVKLEFPADAYDGLIESFAVAYARPETVLVDGVESPNPETKEQFFPRMVIQYVAGIWKAHAQQLALASQQQQVTAAVEARAAEVMAATTVTVEDIP